MAIAVISASPDKIDVAGGSRLELSGTFDMGALHRVTLGVAGDDTDPACYGGVVGQGHYCYPTSTSTLVVFTPRMANAAQPLIVRVTSAVGGAAAILAGALSTQASFFHSQTYALRSLLPPNYAVGARSIASEPGLFALSGP